MISFVVPAHNEQALLAETLRAIHAAAGVADVSHEVVVASDASTDATTRIAAAQGARVVEVNHRQIAATRNSGAAIARGDRLVFVDADTLINAPVLRATIAALDDGAVGGGARVRFEGAAPLPARFLARVFEPFYFWLHLAAGCYLFCTREAFLEAGGFDQRLFASEEISLSRDLKRLGRFVVLPQRVVTSGRKLRTHSLGDMARPLGRMLLRGQRAFQRREGLELWYGERRDG